MLQWQPSARWGAMEYAMTKARIGVAAILITVAACGKAKKHDEVATSEETSKTSTGATTSTPSTSVGASQGAPPSAEPPSTATPPQSDAKKFLAWMLGFRLPLAAMTKGDKASAYKKVQIAADGLGVTVTEFASDDVVEAAGYLNKNRQTIGDALETKHGAEVAALFRGGITSGVMMKLYDPADKSLPQVAEFVGHMQRSKLKKSLWQPLVDSMKAGTARDDVLKEYLAMDKAIQKELNP